MANFKLNRIERVLFALLRLGFSKEGDCVDKGGISNSDIFDSLSVKDWQACYKMACEQGVMAFAMDGVSKLPKEKQPALSVKIPWALAVEEYEKRYSRYCNTIAQLSKFYRENGIATVQMKGVGLSSYYPVPQHREGGDIDIYTYALKNLHASFVDSDDDKRANALADDLIRREGKEVEMHSYKHSNFFYMGIPIENHKCFLNIKEYKYAMDVNNYLKEHLNPQEVGLLEGKYSILIPSLEFNTLFVPFHAFQHYGTGISLHHLCDWYALVQSGALDVWPKEIKDKRFLTAIAAFTQLSDELLGSTSGLWSKEDGVFANSIDVNSANDLAYKILNEMLYPPFSKDIPAKGRLYTLVYKTRRLIHRHMLTREVFERSLIVTLLKSIIAHIKRPETIFLR